MGDQFSARFLDELEQFVQDFAFDETTNDLHVNLVAQSVELPSAELLNESRNGEISTPDACDLINEDESSRREREMRQTRSQNVSRDRRRAELSALREEAEKLELQRTLLLLKRKRIHDAHHHNEDGTPVEWKRMAEIERNTRQQAEKENARLSSVLQQQLRLSKTLENLLQRRLELDDHDEISVARPKRIQSEASLGMLHAQFLREIRRVYATPIGRIFTGDDWASVNGELGLSMIREASTDSLTEEMRDTRYIPFKYERVVEAAMRCSLHPFVEQGRILEAFGSADDQIALKYKALTPRNNADRGDLLTAVMVLKRFVETDRTIHVWRSMLSANEDDVDVFQRAYSDETGWLVVERVPDGIPGFEPGTAVVRIVAQLTPLWPSTHESHASSDGGTGSTDVVSGKKLQPQDFLELVVDATYDDLVAMTQAMENLLVDECGTR